MKSLCKNLSYFLPIFIFVNFLFSCFSASSAVLNSPLPGIEHLELQKLTPLESKVLFGNRQVRTSSVSAPPVGTPRSAQVLSLPGTANQTKIFGGTSGFGNQSEAVVPQSSTIDSNKVMLRSGEIVEPPDGMDGPSRSSAQMQLSPMAITQVSPEIAELARSLRYNPALIWEFIYNNIDYAHPYGVTRGPLGTLLDRKGNSFDQSSLMVALLQESGYNARFIHGQIRLSPEQLTDWLGIENRYLTAENYFRQAGIPATVVGIPIPGGEYIPHFIDYVEMEHVWVVVNYYGSDYIFDPSLKVHEIIDSGIDIAAISGYDQASFLSSALAGATRTADSIQNINRASVQSLLQGYTQNLISHIKTQMPGASLDDVLGGKKIKSLPFQGWKTIHPYEIAGTSTEWPTIPDTYRRSLRIRYEGIDATAYSDQLYGKRLTLFLNDSNQPELRLDSDLLGTGSVIISGQNTSLIFTVNLPLMDSHSTGTYTKTKIVTVKSGVPYAIVNGWGVSGRRNAITMHRKRLAQFRYDGLQDDSEQVLGESLALFAATWLAETSRVNELADSISNDVSLRHHVLGVVGFDGGAYIDVPMEGVSHAELDIDLPRASVSLWAAAGFASAFEWGAIEQLQPTKAVSTIKLIDYAVTQGQKVFDVTNSNWASVQSELVEYSAPDLANIQEFIDQGYRIILPENGSLLQGDWRGVGYISFTPNGSQISHIITGGSKGGWSEYIYDVQEAVWGFFSSLWDENFGSGSIFAGELSRDPINMVTGDLLYQHEDLSIGSEKFPYGLELHRSYASGARLLERNLGQGWRHNFDINIRPDSDGFQGMGEDSPIDAASALVGLFVAMDMYGAFTDDVAGIEPIRDPEHMLSAVLVVRWTMDQLVDNVAIVDTFGKSLKFVRLVDGTYNPPPGSSATLTLENDDSYMFRAVHGAEIDFDVSGQPLSWQHPNGVRLDFTHTNGLLQTVTNNLGRSLTFTYTEGNLLSVVDDSGRSVNYAYDSLGNLTSYVDTNDDVTTYTYDLPGRLTHIYSPSQPQHAQVTNIYNALDQVIRQVDGAGNQWQYFFAMGLKSEEFSPVGAYSTWYFDEQGNKITERNQVLETTNYDYDGHNNLVKVTYPETNAVQYGYDNNHNIISVIQKAKQNSTELTITENFTYHPIFNVVLTYTNPLDQLTTYTYDQHTGNLLTVAEPEVGGQVPLSSYTYNNKGQVLTSTDPTGYVVRNIYDEGTGDLLSTIRDAGRLNIDTKFTYDSVGNLISVTDPNDNTTTFAYDLKRRKTSILTAGQFNYETRFTYDKDGRVTKKDVETGVSINPWSSSRYLYDEAGRLALEYDPENNSRHFYYDYWGNIIVSYDEEYRKTTFIHDIANRLFSISDNLNQVQREYIYTPNGRIASVKDANLNITNYEYDGFDRLSRVIYPDSSFEIYTYDDVGNLLSKRTRLGQSINWTYDGLNRTKTKISQEVPLISYDYDLADRLLRVTDASGSISNSYDTAGRLTSTTNTDNKSLKYEYDDAGNRTKLTYSDDDFITYTYDALNRLEQIRDASNAALAKYNYDSLSRKLSVTYGNGTQIFYDYERDDDIAEVTNQFSGSSVSFQYSHNKAHQRVRVDIDNDNFAVGNWPTTNVVTTYSTNSLNQYTQADGVALQYDENGNLIDDGINSYRYDSNNRLIEASPFVFEYDSLGRRTQKITNDSTIKYLYDQDQVVEEFDDNGQLLRRYIFGLNLDQPVLMMSDGDRYYYHFDGLGSIIALSDSAGVDVERYAYGPFGEDAMTSSDLGNPYRYTARRFDEEIGLYYYRARHYSASLKRFMQVDPVGYRSGMNLYTYVSNDPLNFVDPLGLFQLDMQGEYSDLIDTQIDEETINQLFGSVIPGAGMITGLSSKVAPIAGRLFSRAIESVRLARIAPANLIEQIALQEARSGAGTGVFRRIMQGRVNDPRYPENLWAKIEYVRVNPDNSRVVIHFWENLATGAKEGFKFK